MKRVFIIVLDSLGIGAEPDAADFGDVGANTLRSVSAGKGFAIPHLLEAGMGNLDGVDYLPRTDKPTAALARLRERGQTLCEEIIRQHPDLNAIWPGSINTVRMVTILKDGKAHVVAAYLRVGNGPRPVDNFNNGGMVVPLDRETGVILCHARDKAGRFYECHPVTGTRFQGTRVPMWPEILALLQDAAQVVPSIRYVGWDVAVTPEGPLLVEGNQYPGHDIYGLPGQSPDKRGILPNLDAVVPYRSL